MVTVSVPEPASQPLLNYGETMHGQDDTYSSADSAHIHSYKDTQTHTQKKNTHTGVISMGVASREVANT